jgi:hypothetical protein
VDTLVRLAPGTISARWRFVQSEFLLTAADVSILMHRGKSLGEDFSERKICGDTAQAVNFYFPSEATFVEVAFGLRNPQTEFEKVLELEGEPRKRTRPGR